MRALFSPYLRRSPLPRWRHGGSFIRPGCCCCWLPAESHSVARRGTRSCSATLLTPQLQEPVKHRHFWVSTPPESRPRAACALLPLNRGAHFGAFSKHQLVVWQAARRVTRCRRRCARRRREGWLHTSWSKINADGSSTLRAGFYRVLTFPLMPPQRHVSQSPLPLQPPRSPWH